MFIKYKHKTIIIPNILSKSTYLISKILIHLFNINIKINQFNHKKKSININKVGRTEGVSTRTPHQKTKATAKTRQEHLVKRQKPRQKTQTHDLSGGHALKLPLNPPLWERETFMTFDDKVPTHTFQS